MAISDWSTTASSNGNSDANINWQEGQAPSTVNDSARSMMTRLKHWWNQLGGNITSGGSSNAYTLTSGESLSAYATGMRFLWKPNAAPTGAATMNVDSIGAKKLFMPDGTQVQSGELDANSFYDIVYDAALDTASGGFQIIGFEGESLTETHLLSTNNLSDVDSASTSLSNLGGQPLDATLTALAGLSVSSGDFIKATGTDTFTVVAGGSGGGLDADTVDGVQASAFAQLSGATFTGAVGVSISSGFAINLTCTGSADGISVATQDATSNNAFFWQQGSDTMVNIFSDASNRARFYMYSGGSNTVQIFAEEGAVSKIPKLQTQTPASSETSGTLTSASANRQIDLAGTITINPSVFAAGDIILLYSGASSRTITQGTSMTLRLDGTATTGSRTLAARGLAVVRFISASEAVVAGSGVS